MNSIIINPDHGAVGQPAIDTSVAPPESLSSMGGDTCFIASPIGDVLPGKTDPDHLAARVAEYVRSGVRSEIKGYRLVAAGLRTYESDLEMLDRFIEALVARNLIPAQSARLGANVLQMVDKSRLSMMVKVGENAELLLDTRIFKHLRPGRSLLYYVFRLHHELDGEYDARIEQMAALFEAEGQISRTFLIKEVKRLQESRKAPKVREHDPLGAQADQRLYDVVLLTPNRRHARRASDDYSQNPAGLLPRCLRVHERVSKDAIAIAVARMSDLPVIQNKLLAGCGFGSPSKVFLLRTPLTPDVTDAEIAVVAERSAQDCIATAKMPWLNEGYMVDPYALVESIVPCAAHKLHVFASERREGWDSLIDDANWSVTDE